MKIKFSKYERVAGLFVLAAIGGAIVISVGTGLKRGWFEAKTPLVAVFPHAEGIYSGTPVQMAGLRAGTVDDVELTSSNEVRVRFSLKNQFFVRTKEDSKVQIIRPFIIGEKMLDVSVGTATVGSLKPGDTIKTVDSMDLMDMLSGKSLGPQLSTLAKAAESLRIVVEALTDPKRTQSFIETIDAIQPLLMSATDMTREMTRLSRKINRTHDLEDLLSNAVLVTGEVNKILPQLNESAPNFGQDIGHMSQEIAGLTNELAKLTPMLTQMAPEMPHATKRVFEALDETVVTLKAIQRSFLLRGSTREVREEEKKRDEAERAPASQKNVDK